VVQYRHKPNGLEEKDKNMSYGRQAETIWKVYATRSAAEKYIAKNLAHEATARVAELGGAFWVVSF